MVKRSVLFKPLRIFIDLLSLILKEIVIKTRLLWSLLTIIATTHLYMAPYQDLYGRRCRSPIGWFEVGESSLLGPELIYKTLDTVHIIRKSLVNSV